MTLKSVFLGRTGLRAGWRAAIFVVIAQAVSALFALVAFKVVGYRPSELWVARDFWLSESAGLVAALLATFLMARLGRRRMSVFGFPLVRSAPRLFAVGVLMGAVLVSLLVAGIAAAGGVSIHGWALSGPALAQAALNWAGIMILLGFFEESMFRGYLLVTMSEGMRFWPAAILLSVLFGALHYFTKPMETLTDFTTVSLIGLLLCFSFRRTGSLWLAAGFHAAFDFAALVLFGAPNTGNHGKPLADRLLATEFHGPTWLTGGVCGIEASWLIVPLVAAAFLVIHRVYRRTVLLPAA